MGVRAGSHHPRSQRVAVITTKTVPLLTHIKLDDVKRLQEIFAVRKEWGWHIPGWLCALAAASVMNPEIKK